MYQYLQVLVVVVGLKVQVNSEPANLLRVVFDWKLIVVDIPYLVVCVSYAIYCS